MYLNSEQLFDLAEPTQSVWSLRFAELPYKNGNEESYHACLLLVDETRPDKPVAVSELHFLPVDRREDGSVIPHKAGQTSRPAFLGAAAYRNPFRDMSRLITVTYERGSPREMLGVWNKACKAALKIADLQLPFVNSSDDPGAIENCRAGAKAVIGSLGHTFQELAGPPVMKRGVGTRLTVPEGPDLEPDAVDADSVQQQYQVLQQRLTLSRR
jgi:hypothetical protein